jgi:sugar lactone lactonase YvrE/mono/diheme cytochrome c family protein
MRRAVFITALAVGAGVLIAGQLRAQDGPKSVWDGVYTEAQAERGKAAYTQSCVFCHGPELAGTGEAKPLAGPEFLSSWNGLSVGELLDRTRTTMPQQAPASLDRAAYADILAYMLKFNGFPAGQSELQQRSEFLTGVRIDAFKPEASKPAASAADAFANDAAAATAPAPNSQPNPYATDPAFFVLPPGRTMGSSSAVAVDSKGHVWVADRCGANSCTGSKLDPIMEFDARGKFLKGFGGGMFNFPHGLFIDAHDHLWFADNRAEGGKGAVVVEFDQSGKLLRTLGKPGVSAVGDDTFAEPNAVLAAPNGSIFVADGHTPNKDPARIVKFDASGKFVKAWGTRGSGEGQMEVPHALAMDSKGRLFVGDRWNNRLVIFDQDGKFLDAWSQFGRPSGVFIDRNDVLYVADSESREPQGYGYHPGWKRGLRIGSAKTGRVEAFIPDTEPNPDKVATSGAEGITADGHGVVYGAQVLQKAVVRYAKRP